MASIVGTSASLDVDMMHGLPQQLKSRADVWEVPGLDGYGVQDLAQGDAEFQLVTVTFYFGSTSPTNNANANTDIDTANSLQARVVTVSDDFGDDYTGCIVKHVASKKMPCIHRGDARAIRLEITWSMV